MLRNLLSALTLASLAVGCGGSEDPIDAEIGVGTLAGQIGPGGGVLRGRGATELNGFSLKVPPGALRELVDIEVRIGAALPLPGTLELAPAVQVTVSPDPGPLLMPATLRMPVRLPIERQPEDVLVAGAVPSWASGSTVGAVGLASEGGTYDPTLQVFTAELGLLGDHQVRMTSEPRRAADARSFRELAVAALDRQTDAGLMEADQHLAAALVADPYNPAARLLRAMTRVLVIANDRRDPGPGIDSIGEVATAWGLDLRTKSLLRRYVEDDWPRVYTPATARPAVADLIAFLQNSLRPALAAGTEDLRFVPPQGILELELPPVLAATFPGLRQFDAADTLFLGALFEFTGYALDALEDLDTGLDVGALLATPTDIESLLAQYPGLGRLVQAPTDATRSAFSRGGRLLELALAALRAEADDQSDDMVTFSATATAVEIDQLIENVRGLLRSFEGGAPHSLLYASRPALPVDLAVVGVGLDYRTFLPRFSRCDPLAGSMIDSTFGGLFPGLGQDAASRWFELSSAGTLPLSEIVVDGDVSDWPAAAELLLPNDRPGDTGLANFDLSRVWLARTPNGRLGCRLSLASGGEFVVDPTLVSTFGFDLRGQAEVPAVVVPEVRVTVTLRPSGLLLAVTVDDQPVDVVSRVATASGELEFSLDRFEIFPVGSPVQRWALRAFSEARDLAGVVLAEDSSRWVLFDY